VTAVGIRSGFFLITLKETGVAAFWTPRVAAACTQAAD
jgi:hypothetical protein